MTTYDDELVAHSRTPQSILTLGVRYCANWYSQTVADTTVNNTDFTPLWATTVGTTTDVGTHQPPNAEPDSSYWGTTVSFAGVGDALIQTFGTSSTSSGFTGSWWLRTTSGTGTITIRLTDNITPGAGEYVDIQVNVTETWTRFWINKLFSGGSAGNARLSLSRETGDLAEVVAWAGNNYRNSNDEDAVIKFPTVIHLASEAQNSGTCTAADAGDGSRCFFTFPTCQDPANFNVGNTYEATADLRGFREYRFCMKNLPFPLGGEDIKPYIESVDNASQKIDPEKSVTITERFAFNFADDSGPGLWDATKSGDGALVNTQTGTGTFWRRWGVIHKNFANPKNYAIYKVGFVADGMTEALYEQRFKGLLRNLEIDGRGRVKLTCSDFLKLLKAEIPAKISDDNLLNGGINSSVTAVVVDDVTELSDLFTTSGDFIVTIKIDDEKFNVTAVDVDTNTFTVERGRWGTVAASHSDNVAWSEVAEFGTERDTPANTPAGKNLIDCVIELHKRGGIATENIDVSGLRSERDDWLPSTINTQNGYTVGLAVRRSITEPGKVEDLIRELKEISMLSTWVNESQQVTGKVFAPAKPGETLTELDETNELIGGSIEVDDNDEDSRVTRALVAYDLATDGDPEKLGDYEEILVRVDSDAESSGFYGEKKLKVFLSQWVRGGDVASVNKMLVHYLSRFRNGARLVSFALERKNDSVKVGDFVKLTTQKIQDAHGSPVSGRIMQILSKKRAGQGRQEHEALDTGLFRKYGFIAPAGHPDYGSATEDNKRYGYIGGELVAGDGQNLVGDGDIGYFIW